MDIKFKEDKYSLIDFLINDNTRQGVVERGNGWDRKCFLYKIEEVNKATSIFCGNSSNYRPDFVLSINHNDKFIIYQDHYNWRNLEDELKDIDYQIWEGSKLSDYINNQYINKVREKLKDNLDYIKQTFTKYNREYGEALKNYQPYVEREYLNNPDIIDYKIYLDRVSDFGSNNLYNLQRYLSDNTILDKYVDQKYNDILNEKDYGKIIIDLAIREAENIMLNNMKNNPSDFVKLSLRIRECIKDHTGKTMNIETKDGRNIKVKNLYDGYSFSTVAGYNRIKIEDIKKITFSRKVLFGI